MDVRPFKDYDDACLAVAEAGGVYLTNSNAGQAGRSFAPTVTYRMADGSLIDILWASGRGYIRRR